MQKKPLSTTSVLDSYNGLDGMGAARGGVFEMGSVAYIKSLPFPEMMALGIDFSFLNLSWNKVDWSNLGTNWTRGTNTPFMFFGWKAGPVFSVNVVDKLIIDGFYKLNPTMLIGGTVNYEYTADKNNITGYSTRTGLGFGWNHGIGANIRYHKFVLGAEYNFGKLKYELTEIWDGKENGISYYDTEVNKVKTPVKMLFLSLGFQFEAQARPMGSGSGAK